MKEPTTRNFGLLTLALLLGLGFSLSLTMLASAQQALVSEPAAAPNLAPAADSAIQQSCTLPATVTTADELYNCITEANANGAGSDTITLSADIDLTTLTTSPLPDIDTAIVLEGAGYAIDGGSSVRIFIVGSSGNLTVNQATLQNGFASTGASTGGGIRNLDGTLTVTNSTFSGNSATSGGGIENYGTVTVSNSTFSGNSASSRGGGIENYGTVTVSNSTFSGNSAGTAATQSGGGIQNYGTVTVTNSTFSGNSANSGGGIANEDGTLHLAGSIFAVGANGTNCSNINGTLIDNGYNLSDDTTCTNGGTGSATNATLNLGPLADNGGPTLTHLPGAGSDAIDAIPNSSCNLSADQRGVSRPQGNACDSGAVEIDVACFVSLNDSGTTDYASEDAVAVQAAIDTASAGDTLKIAGTCTGISPAGGLFQTVYITRSLTLEGGYDPMDWAAGQQPGTYTTTLDAAGLGRVAFISDTASVTLDSLFLTGGNSGAGEDGGGIYNLGTLLITNSTIYSNTAVNAGGGIYSTGILTVTGNSLIDNNRTLVSCGGGINFGGNSDGRTTIRFSTVSNNTSFSYGGGIFAGGSSGPGGVNKCSTSASGALDLDHVEVFGNLATNQEGGGIANYDVPMTINHSAIYNNRSDEDGDGGVGAWGPATISNTTISGNSVAGGSAQASGGLGMYGGHDVYLYNVTITDNTMESTVGGSGGVSDWDSGSPTLHVYNSIIANNSGGVQPDCYMPAGNIDFHNVPNIVTQELAGCGALNAGAVNNVDPDLGPLADNGGGTQTHLPLPGSPAIDTGDNATCTSDDQRGISRPQGDICDIGAYEREYYHEIYLPFVTRNGP